MLVAQYAERSHLVAKVNRLGVTVVTFQLNFAVSQVILVLLKRLYPDNPGS